MRATQRNLLRYLHYQEHTKEPSLKATPQLPSTGMLTSPDPMTSIRMPAQMPVALEASVYKGFIFIHGCRSQGCIASHQL